MRDPWYSRRLSSRRKWPRCCPSHMMQHLVRRARSLPVLLNRYVALWNSLIEANIVTDDTCVTQPSSGYCCELDRPISDVFLDFTFESTADAPGTSFTVSRPFSQMVQSCGIGNYFYPTVRLCFTPPAPHPTPPHPPIHPLFLIFRFTVATAAVVRACVRARYRCRCHCRSYRLH